MSKRSTMIYLSILTGWLASITQPATLHAQQRDIAVQEARQRMEAFAGGAVQITQSPVSELATFVAAAPGKAIPTFMSPTAPPEERGRKFLDLYGTAFGITAPEQVQVQRVQARDEVGMEHVRFHQVHHGVPVTAGEMIVHLRGAHVTAVTAKTLPDLEQVETTPHVAPQEALVTAQAVLAKHLKVTDATLSTPRLEVFNQGLLEDRQSPTRLAWFIEATKIDVRELIWIDARQGGVLLHFSQLTDARLRRIHDTNSSAILPGTLVRSEGGAATGDLDVDTAYNFSGDTYNYFFTQHGRDSYDGAGAALISTVDFCPSPAECPYQNAFWNGTQMVYGLGFSRADDVDAHELTHAVTERAAGLFYYMQSGALNESFSDIFGETVDLTNVGGTDTAAVRWQMGEDLPSIGAIRNMRDPTLFGDPGKVSDPQFVCLTPGGDAGGVHSNSGVPNHAYALMVDGGTYNGQTITPLGLTKAGKIQYRTLNTYLVSGSGFLDNYNAMRQACTDLVGTAGITAADCAQVKKALDAVEMANPVCAQPAAPALCPAGQNPTNLFFDNLENPASGKWTTTTATGVNHWLDDATHTAFGGCTGTPDVYCSVFASSGTRSFWGYDAPVVGDSAVAMTANVAIPAGARMQFKHSFGFENGSTSNYDGGVVEYSTNGGATWTDAGTLITSGRTYNGTIGTGSGNPLAGRNAFVRESFGYTASQLTLNTLSGQNVRFRLRMGTDSSVDDYGWFVDDVQIYTCAAPPARTLRINDVTRAEGNSGTTAFDFTVTLSAAATSNVTVTYATANGTAVAPGDYATLAPTVLTFTPGQTSKQVRVNVVGEGVVEANETFVVNLSAPSGATLADGQGRGTILNDDGPRLSITDVARTEGTSGTTAFVFTVTLGAVAASNVTVNCVTANGSATAPADYGAVNLPLVFTPGQTIKTCTVPVVGNTIPTGVEPNETFFVNLTNVVGPATLFDGQGLGTILNDDGPLLSINNVTLTEGNTGTSNFNFTVTLSLAAATDVTVNCVAANGTAAAGSDYTAGTTALTFFQGQTFKTCTVPVVGDGVVEPNEYFVVNLTSAVGPATIVDGQGLGVILNNDGPLLRISDVTLTEGNAGNKSFNFLVTLSPAAATNVTVNCVTANGTAVAGSDYTAVNIPLTFLPGEMNKTCAVLVVGDAVVEPNETFFVNLTSPVGASIFDADFRGIGTITNDD